MSRKYIILLIIAGFVGLLIGCHAGGNAPFAPNNGETQVLPETRVVDANGRFTEITFPSGAVIKCPNNDTFKEGVKVTAFEQKIPVIIDNSGKFSYIYAYNISAVLPAENSLSADVPVNTIEKPLSVTLPNNSTAGTCYIGTRASESEPWRYSLVTDGNASNARFMRLSTNPPKTCTFDLYRLNVQFRLFAFDNESSDKAEVDAIIISTGSEDNKVSIENGKYTEDLEIKITLNGEKLDSINADNLIARIIYRNSNLNPAQLKANGSIVKQNDSDDKAVTGGYEHSFEITNIKIESSMSGEAVLSFLLNLNGVSLEDFPTNFLVEFYSDTKDEKALPFIYTQTFSFETKEKQDEPQPGFYALTVNSGTGIASVEGAGDYKPGESVTVKCSIKDGYEFDSWSGDKTGNTIELTFNMPESNVTITANAKAIIYDITYDLAGGALAEDVTNPVTYTVETEFTLSNPTKNGYDFTGWTGSNGDTPERVVKIEKGTTGDKTYTANYSAVAYTITYSLGADDVVNDNPTGFNPDSETFTLNEPTRTGYTFLGWTGSNGDTPQTSVTIAIGSTENKAYTANWSINSYNLTLNKGTGINTVTGAGSYEYNSSVTASCTMIAGYEFDKWSGDLTNETFAMPAKDVTMTANAKVITYSITYNLDGGQLTEDNPSNYTVETESFTLNNPTKEYYEFKGWVFNGGEPVETVTITKGTHENRTYTASFTPTNFTITYKNSDGSDLTTTNPTSYNIESDKITLTNPTRTGYEFIGWTYEGQTTPKQTVTIDKGSTGDKTFTAHFNLPITLTIAADDGVIIDDVNKLYYTKATFTITPTLGEGVTMNDTEKANILSAISVKDSAGTSFGNATATWNNDGKIALSFKEHLTASTTFTISFGDVDEMTITCEPKTIKTFYFKGKGADDNRYQIECAEQLDFVRNYLDKHFVQTADIDLGAYTTYWKPIGVNTARFIGSYYGNGKLIQNLTIHTSEDVDYLGLFGYVGDTDKTAEIASITVDGVSIRGANANDPITCPVGIIAYKLFGSNSSIKNCVVTNSSGSNSEILARRISGICITSEGHNSIIQKCNVENCDIKYSKYIDRINIAGICYSSNGSIDSCHVNNVNISCSNFSKDVCIGGICFYNYKTINDCSVKNSSIICETTNNNDELEIEIGGICGEIVRSIDGCSLSNTTIKAVSTKTCYVGGICCNPNLSGSSLKNSKVENSVLTASGTQGFIGGIAGGGNEGTIDSCHIIGTKVYGEDLNELDDNEFKIGGIIGSSGQNNEIKKCYITNSTVQGIGTAVGGICGYSDSDSMSSCYITNSTVQGKNSYANIGGISGYNKSGSITSCYVTDSSSIISEVGLSQSKTGGICGRLVDSVITKCYVTGSSSIISKGIDGCFTGGICGWIESGSITSCYVTESSSIISEGMDGYIGGICGKAKFDDDSYCISYCYLKNTTVEGDTNTGGICGILNGGNSISLTSCYVEGSIISGKNYIGGLCGNWERGSITSCYVKDTTVSSVGDYNHIGGLCGSEMSNGIYSLSACYLYESNDTYKITSSGNDCEFGYLVGFNKDSIVQDCFTNLSGTLVGYNNGGSTLNTYGGITSLSTFTTDNGNKRSWTDNLDYRDNASFNDANSVWKAYDFSSFPPTLKSEN